MEEIQLGKILYVLTDLGDKKRKRKGSDAVGHPQRGYLGSLEKWGERGQQKWGGKGVWSQEYKKGTLALFMQDGDVDRAARALFPNERATGATACSRLQYYNCCNRAALHCGQLIKYISCRIYCLHTALQQKSTPLLQQKRLHRLHRFVCISQPQGPYSTFRSAKRE